MGFFSKGFEKLKDKVDDFRKGVDDVDEEKVERESLKDAAHELQGLVVTAIRAEDDIESPAVRHESGPGPSMHTRDAWRVRPDGDNYIVEPKPLVEQRAYVLNYGYPGRIYPNGDYPLSFTINGFPVAAEWVEGPDHTGYWEAAISDFEASGRFEEILINNLEEEIRAKVTRR